MPMRSFPAAVVEPPWRGFGLHPVTTLQIVSWRTHAWCFGNNGAGRGAQDASKDLFLSFQWTGWGVGNKSVQSGFEGVWQHIEEVTFTSSKTRKHCHGSKPWDTINRKQEKMTHNKTPWLLVLLIIQAHFLSIKKQRMDLPHLWGVDWLAGDTDYC